MIASKDSTDWIIATASRSGSSHLRTALTQEAKKRPENPVAEFLNPWQGGKKEDVPQYDERIFLAREPMERWNSLFYYFKNVQEKPDLADRLDDFADFMDGIVSREWSDYDCTPLTDHLEDFEPHRVLLLRDFDLLWSWIDAPYFWKHYYYNKSSTHSNPDKRPLEETLDQYGPLSEDAQRLVAEERAMLEECGAFDHTAPTLNIKQEVVEGGNTDFEVRSIPPSKLTPHPENYRSHPPHR